MKSQMFKLTVIMSVLCFLSVGCTEKANPEAATGNEKNAMIDGNCCAASGTLSSQDTASLFYMAEEEKMARDVYTYFSSLYSLPVFRNIPKSEAIHFKAIGNLISGFKLPYTGSDTQGAFVNQEIAGLYKELTAKGSVSLEEALKVGALVEETDILDLEKEILLTQNISVKTVYRNLLQASENHLRAFTGILLARKITYQPALLNDDYYNAIRQKTTASVDYDGKRARN
jgi:hypothetical protein